MEGQTVDQDHQPSSVSRIILLGNVCKFRLINKSKYAGCCLSRVRQWTSEWERVKSGQKFNNMVEDILLIKKYSPVPPSFLGATFLKNAEITKILVGKP